jgi:hypothetical protein
MYGTIFYVRPKSGREDEIKKLFEEWNKDRQPDVAGAKSGYLYKLDKGGMMGVAVFDSKENYQRNADDPAQDEWYRKFRGRP